MCLVACNLIISSKSPNKVRKAIIDRQYTLAMTCKFDLLSDIDLSIGTHLIDILYRTDYRKKNISCVNCSWSSTRLNPLKDLEWWQGKHTLNQAYVYSSLFVLFKYLCHFGAFYIYIYLNMVWVWVSFIVEGRTMTQSMF